MIYFGKKSSYTICILIAKPCCVMLTIWEYMQLFFRTFTFLKKKIIVQRRMVINEPRVIFPSFEQELIHPDRRKEIKLEL